MVKFFSLAVLSIMLVAILTAREYKAPPPIDFGELLYDTEKLPRYTKYIKNIKTYDKDSLNELSRFFVYIHSNSLQQVFSRESSFILQQMKRIEKLDKPVFYNVLNMSLLQNLTQRNTTVFFRKLKKKSALKILDSIRRIENDFDYPASITREINIVISKKRKLDCSDYLVNELMSERAIHKKALVVYLDQIWNQINKPDQVVKNSLFNYIIDPSPTRTEEDIISYFFITDNMNLDINLLNSEAMRTENFLNFSIFMKYFWKQLRSDKPDFFRKIISDPVLFNDIEIAFQNCGLDFKSMVEEFRDQMLKTMIIENDIRLRFINRAFVFSLSEKFKELSVDEIRKYILKVPSLAFKLTSIHPQLKKIDVIKVTFSDSFKELYRLTSEGFTVNFTHSDF